MKKVLSNVYVGLRFGEVAHFMCSDFQTACGIDFSEEIQRWKVIETPDVGNFFKCHKCADVVRDDVDKIVHSELPRDQRRALNLTDTSRGE